jgi:hypothetical protein
MSDEPTRTTVEARWAALADGTGDRQQTHDWTVPWVEGDEVAPDPLVQMALTRLHGFSLTDAGGGHLQHGGSGPYVHSEAEIGRLLEAWRRDAADYDRDPAGWVRARREAARVAAAAQRERAADEG